jgi:hypothetical protein
MKLIEVIEEQLLQNLRNKVQTAAQNIGSKVQNATQVVGDKVNSLINNNQPQQQTQLPTQQNSNQLSTEFNQFVEKYKNLNSDKTKMNYGFGQASGDDDRMVKNNAYNNAEKGITDKYATTTTDGNKTTSVTKLKGGMIPIDEKSYGLQDKNGKIIWYHAVVIEFKNSQQ